MKTIIVLFGITGDLSRRKLLPALESIKGEVPQPFELIGVSRQDIKASEIVPNGSSLESVTSVAQLDLNVVADYKRLWDDRLANQDAQILVFLAVPPLSIPMIVKNLSTAGFDRPNVKLLLEKPFGVDEQTAEELFQEVFQVFDESRLYFVDHYLGKRVSRDIVQFREQSPTLASVWNKENIDRVEVVASETLDIEGRAAFYEQTGALRDVLQGHLLQLLSLTILSLDDFQGALPVQRAQALMRLFPANPDYSVRGQYEGYRDEVSSPESKTETYAEMTFYSEEPNWDGVPMILTTGKALDQKETSITVHFRETNHLPSGYISFDIQPNATITTHFESTSHIATQIDSEVSRYDSQQAWDGYENIFLDALHGNRTFFVTKHEVLASWRAVGRVLEEWELSTIPPFLYAKASSIESIRDKFRER